MSFILFRMIDAYARWREAFLSKFPQKRLIPPTGDGEPLITFGEKGKNIGILALAVIAILALAGRSE